MDLKELFLRLKILDKPYVVEIGLPMEYTELLTLYSDLSISGSDIEIIEIMHNNTKEANIIIEKYINSGEIDISDMDTLETICCIFEKTYKPLGECIEIYNNNKYEILTIEEFENIAYENALSTLKSKDVRGSIIPCLVSTVWNDSLVSCSHMSESCINSILKDIDIYKFGELFMSDYSIIEDIVISIQK
ncbi:hypothetical protein [Clostridium tertium]|uniref:hypothetical protein n=1 Tax=Clostridium tertium TaxID=1559 RepID=UPI0023B22239|nr:hypothetical protein [Clostridium tertium]